MPKRVDHDVRRREMAAALVRCARTRGLGQCGFREVAAEAGVSVNLVQYYFPTKEALLLGGLVYLRGLIGARFDDLPSEPRARVRGLLESVLPTDEASTDLYRVHAAYAALAFTDPALAAQPHAAGPDELLPVLSDLLTALAVPEPAVTATALLALCTGLSAYLTSGFLTAADALRVLHAELDRVC
ncbi:TetR/AcrR family transcriptional regulator [Actinophytocola sp. NPDC049390]|uniref:TetR/AcrR family transcriptional regulator n=1 Tax=Actinophytocola sp. NPDC049390 TaxID=3363894 RepID=UPI003794E2AE